MSADHQGIKLQISGQVRELLESRGIRDEDVRKVVENAEEKEEKLYREDRYLAKLEVEEATFYVEYSVLGEQIYLVHTAYSHRAKVQEE